MSRNDSSLYYQVETYLHDQAPWIFLYDQQDIYGVLKALNWKPRGDEIVSPYAMS